MERIKKLDIALALGIVIALGITIISTFAKDYEGITEEVLRIHVLANSDSDEDQELKLKVRDAVLAETEVLFANSTTRLEAEMIVVENQQRILEVAQQTIKDNGYDYPVKVELKNMLFDDRRYDGFTMPSGTYDAVRISIGEAEGKNWWCVMFPPLCLGPSLSVDTEEVFADEQVKVLEEPEKFKVKFKVVEIFNDVKEKLFSLF